MMRHLLNASIWLLPLVAISMDRWAPKASGIRDPRDKNKRSGGLFWNWPRFLYFGGTPGAPQQAGTKGPELSAANSQNAAAPISDRGKGGRR